jgi:uncharacterized protein
MSTPQHEGRLCHRRQEAFTVRVFVTLLLFVALLPACSGHQAELERGAAMQGDRSSEEKWLTFACSHEADRIPARDPESEQLYRHARWLRKGNILKKDPAVYTKVERLIRIATAYGHDKANLELRELIEKGQAVSATPVTESVNLVEDLIRRGIPGGYFDMGRYLLNGYGVKRDPEAGLNYIRKAADLGNPEAQYWIGVKLSPVDKAPEIAVQMMLCAGEQGHKVAAQQVGYDLQTDGDYKSAVYALQLGTKAGHPLAAGLLEWGFQCDDPKNRIRYLALKPDSERAARYSAIRRFLSAYDYLNPSVPELDDIVPLPPAKLPPWNGKFKWLEEHNANVPPPLPSEARIAEMAKAKGLDPATGRPLAWGDTR